MPLTEVLSTTQFSGGGSRVRAGVLVPLVGSKGALRGPEARLEEALGLARSIGLEPIHSEVIPLREPRPSKLLGEGKVANLAPTIRDQRIAVVVVDSRLTPVQQRNLERAWDAKVIDRTALILEIFGARARTREGRLQVELAALSYQKSRLVRSWTHLERQRGGYGFLGGPGESQIEADRRQIGERITRIRRELEQVKRRRSLQRRARRQVPLQLVALVGYTNAGKSTLFNRLTGANALVEDKLFVTLDPTIRGVTLPSGRLIVLADTVGFISDLPIELVAAFRATLEEVVEADLVVHVRDVSHPDSEAQRQDVHRVLRELGLNSIVDAGLIEVLNKIDLLEGEKRLSIQGQASRDPTLVPISALEGEGLERLLALIDRRLVHTGRVEDFRVNLSDGAALAWLYRHGDVLSRFDEGAHAQLRVALEPGDRIRFLRLHGKSAEEIGPVPDAVGSSA